MIICESERVCDDLYIRPLSTVGTTHMIAPQRLAQARKLCILNITVLEHDVGSAEEDKLHLICASTL
jgi:hypothetical protein